MRIPHLYVGVDRFGSIGLGHASLFLVFRWLHVESVKELQCNPRGRSVNILSRLARKLFVRIDHDVE